MGLRTSSQLHAFVLIPTIQSQHQACNHPAWKNTFPSSRLQVGAALHNVYRSMFSFLHRKKSQDFGYLPSLSTPSMKFSRIFSKAFEKLAFPQTSYFSALKGSALVAKGKYIKICVCIYMYL